MLSTYITHFMNDFMTVPVTPASTGVTIFTFHMRRISVVRLLL